MLESGKISGRQFSIIVMLYLIGSAILIIPSILAAEAKQDAWIAALLTIGIALLFIPVYISLGTRFPNKTFAEYIEVIFGKWLGKAVSLFFFILFPLLIAALTLRNIRDFGIRCCSDIEFERISVPNASSGRYSNRSILVSHSKYDLPFEF